VASRGVRAAANEYGIPEDRLLLILTADASSQFAARSRAVLASPYFNGREDEQRFMVRALAGAGEYDDLGGDALAIFDRAEATSGGSHP